MGKVFISYRREDTIDSTGRIYDRLERVFGSETMFWDIDTIPVGVDFVSFIETYIQQTSAMLVIIGPRWLTITDSSGARRLDMPTDYVRLEIETALRLGVRIIPIVVQNALMPPKESLPASIRKFSVLNATQVRSGTDFNEDMGKLISTLAQLLNPTPPTGVVHAVGIVISHDSETFHYGNYGEMTGYRNFLGVTFLNPLTNQQETVRVPTKEPHDWDRYKVGATVRIRINTRVWGWFRRWVIDV